MATAARRIAFKEIAIIAALQCRFSSIPFFAVGDEDGCQGRTSTCSDGKYIDGTIQHNSTQLNTCAEFPIPLYYKILSCFLLIVICELFARALEIADVGNLSKCLPNKRSLPIMYNTWYGTDYFQNNFVLNLSNAVLIDNAAKC